MRPSPRRGSLPPAVAEDWARRRQQAARGTRQLLWGIGLVLGLMVAFIVYKLLL